jgi:hypothetical protein
MKRLGALLFAATVCLTGIAIAGSKKDIGKEIEQTNKDVKAACGCTIKFSYSGKLDFTNTYGSDLAFNVEKTIESIGEGGVRWCKEDEDHAAKFCAMVKSVEVSEDKTVTSPYTVNRGPAITTFIATKNPNQLMNHGDAWVETYLKSGKMPERSSD